jgi:ribosomal protein S27E
MEMMEKVAYLKGLTEGLGLDDSTKEGKVIKLVIDLLDDVVLTLSDVADGFALLEDQLELIDQDLEEIVGDVYDMDDLDAHSHLYEGELYEVTCPSCNDVVYADEAMLGEKEINCPSCGELLEFDLDGELDLGDKASN